MKVRIICNPPMSEQHGDVSRVGVTSDGRLALIAEYNGKETVCCEFAAGAWVAWVIDEPDKITREVLPEESRQSPGGGE